MSEGRLRVEVESPSMFLSQGLPMEVRNARHEVVRRGTSGTSLTLPEGLYSVDVVLPSGERLTKYAQVEPSIQPTKLVFAAQEVDHSIKAAPLTFAGGHDVELEETRECVAEERDQLRWRFESEQGTTPQGVPTASFRVDGRLVVVSIPVNPRARRPAESRCTVTAEWEDDRWHLRTAFDEKRRVASAVDGIDRSGELVGGTELMKQAAELLLHKYSDPPAAALGGLILHRIGRLEERSDWVENLARDFPWLRDGGILLAGLLRNDPRQQERGLDLLLDATADRPMFTDGLSLALDLLRRWPDEQRRVERHERVAELGPLMTGADWNSTNLTVAIDP